MHSLNKRAAFAASAVFTAVELALGVLVQTEGGEVKRWLSFSSVLLAFLFSLLFLEKSGSALFTAGGLLFTVVSDVFLVLLSPQRRVIAMVFFTVAQGCYFMRLVCERSGDLKRHLTVRASVTLLLLFASFAVLGKDADLLSSISMVYYANLAVNLLYAFRSVRRSVLFPFGLLCFILCDTFVGLSVMDGMYFDFSEGSLLYRLTHTELDMIWLFYVPSQTLIALSLPEIKYYK